MGGSSRAGVIRPYDEPSDRPWAEGSLLSGFGGPVQARRGELIDVCSRCPASSWSGPGVRSACSRTGATARTASSRSSRQPHAGVGSALLEALVAAVADCRRIWLVTTNDNLDALRFYQRRGFALSALRSGAVDDARRDLKPQIGAVGDYGITLHDELELALRLPPHGAASPDL